MGVSYLYGMSMLTYLDHSKALRNVGGNFAGVMMVNYAFWPFVNFLNFRLVPLKYRLLVMNLCSLVWNTFLAWYYHRKANKIN